MHVFSVCFIRPVRSVGVFFFNSVGVGIFTYLVLLRGISVSLGLASGAVPLYVALLDTGDSSLACCEGTRIEA